MANDIAHLAAEKKDGVLSNVYTVYDSETEDHPPKDSNTNNSQDDIYNSGVQDISKSNGLECFDMDKSKDSKHDQ
eukprot:3939250-Ditylum_brightwellii.AAC.1